VRGIGTALVDDVKKQVFISFVEEDVAVAQRVYAKLSSEGIRCWMVPNDMAPGQNWADAIVEALDASVAMVLLFSRATAASEHVKSELGLARERNLKIHQLRLEDVKPTKAFAYYLSAVQWINAFPGPIEKYLQPVVKELKLQFDASNMIVESIAPRVSRASVVSRAYDQLMKLSIFRRVVVIYIFVLVMAFAAASVSYTIKVVVEALIPSLASPP
jgi:hypothetical protein